MFTRISRNPVAALLTSTGTLAAVSAMAVTGMVIVGLPSVNSAGPQEALEQTGTARAEWHEAPALSVLTAALTAPPPGWNADGEIQQSVTPPLPYSCPLPGAAASTALARSFNAAGHRIRVTTVAYTAGLGAEAVRLQLANTGVCASDASVRSSTLSGPARDARLTTTTRGGIATSTLMSRRGDVVTYLTGSPGAPFTELASAFDGALSGKLDGVCLNQESTLAEAARSPFAPGGYEPFTENVKVSIPEPSLPAVPAAAKAVTVPSADLVGERAAPQDTPDFPVYPAMPSPVPAPELPVAPAKATLEDSVPVPARDTAGPGCGWQFTGMKQPLFDETAAAGTRATRTAAASAKLAAGAREWQAQVATYWTKYASYEKDAKAYGDYRTKVNAVNSAWSVIASAWADYRTKNQEYQAALVARDDLAARKSAAGAAYDSATEVCNAPVAPPAPAVVPVPAPTATPTSPPEPGDNPSASPTATPSPSPTPAPTLSPALLPTVKQGCPAARPAVLDESPKPVPEKPVPPADPRPKQ